MEGRGGQAPPSVSVRANMVRVRPQPLTFFILLGGGGSGVGTCHTGITTISHALIVATIHKWGEVLGPGTKVWDPGIPEPESDGERCNNEM